MTRIDLNSDLGEGAGADDEIMPWVTSANVACGAHAGDATTMRRTVELALRHGVAIGAHPGYRDPASFGRVALDLPRAALFADLLAQIEALEGIAGEAGGRVTHVKAHGALYNRGERDPETAAVIADAVRTAGRDLVLFASPGSAMETAARAAGLRVAREGFADRAYEPDGTLRPRRLPDSLHTDPAVAARQAVALAWGAGVRASDGSTLALEVETICVHGDTPNAAAIVRAVREALTAAGANVAAAAGPQARPPGDRAPSVE
ncbi:MAG: 5-oxoprolinase subunit PxpA [Candidatus Limnocylindria bacterium]